MSQYIGRFAPSPTGPLHTGSLLAALISYLDARANNGKWLVRIEDIDPPREIAGASEAILSALVAHGLRWDDEILYQSKNSERYEEQLIKLLQSNSCYYCPCSRKQLAERSGAHLPECGVNTGKTTSNSAIRFHATASKTLYWRDLVRGEQSLNIQEDFVLKRKDGLYAYQLAVVTDDIDQNITHVIRGADLLDSTPMQLALYDALGTPPPLFGHFPLVLNESGQKLSKQNLAPAIDIAKANSNLIQLARWLKLEIAPHWTDSTTPEEMLSSFTQQWALTEHVGQHDFNT